MLLITTLHLDVDWDRELAELVASSRPVVPTAEEYDRTPASRFPGRWILGATALALALVAVRRRRRRR